MCLTVPSKGVPDVEDLSNQRLMPVTPGRQSSNFSKTVRISNESFDFYIRFRAVYPTLAEDGSLLTIRKRGGFDSRIIRVKFK